MRAQHEQAQAATVQASVVVRERRSALGAIPATERAGVDVLDAWLETLQQRVLAAGGHAVTPRGWEFAVVLAWCAGAGISIVAAADRRAVLMRGLGGRFASPRVLTIAKAKLAATCGGAELPVALAAQLVDESLQLTGLAMRTASIPKGKRNSGTAEDGGQ